MEKLVLKSFADADIGKMQAWLCKEHVRPWYENPEDWLHEIRERHGAFPWIQHFIVLAGDVPIGVCQYYDCYDANELEDWYDVRIKGDTYSIDYLIGETKYLGKGYGKAIVELLTRTIRAVEGAKQIVVQPDKKNHASGGVLLANGYVYDEQLGYYYKELCPNHTT